MGNVRHHSGRRTAASKGYETLRRHRRRGPRPHATRTWARWRSARTSSSKLNGRRGRHRRDPRRALRGRRHLRTRRSPRPTTPSTMTMEDAQKLVYDDLPDAAEGPVDPEHASSRASPSTLEAGVTPRGRGGVASSANDRRRRRHDARRLRAAGHSSRCQIFTSVIYAIALISLLVGGLSVINTMTMSVVRAHPRDRRAQGDRRLERARSWGSSSRESAVIGLIGGARGTRARRLIADGRQRGGRRRAATRCSSSRTALAGRLARCSRSCLGTRERPVPGVARRQPQPRGGAAL